MISNQNPLYINIPSVFGTSNMGGSKRIKRIEIEDFKWLGTFPKDHKITLDGYDYENIPPNFFYFSLGQIITDGVINKEGQNINIIEFAHPSVGFEHFGTLLGTQSTNTSTGGGTTTTGGGGTTTTGGGTTTTGGGGTTTTGGATTVTTPVVDLDTRPSPSPDINGGNILQQWEKITSTSIGDTLVNVNVPTVNSAVVSSYSHYKILYSINNDHSDGIELGNLLSGKLQIDIMANINIMQARKDSRDPLNFSNTLQYDLYNNENVLYPFERRNVSSLGQISEDYVLRFRIYDVDEEY